MDDSRICEEIVTKFLLNTCRLHLHRNDDDKVWAWLYCAHIATEHQSVDDEEAGFIPTTTGSVAEFYIQPMLSCIGDVDVMLHRSNELAIPRGFPPPTELPHEFDSRVKVYEIVDSELPGYAYLISSHLLTECIDDSKYDAVECQRQYICKYTGLLTADSVTMHGPAHLKAVSRRSTALVVRLAGSTDSVDLIKCVRCLSWPPQAADWPTRHKNYGWPDSATVDHVVSNGCDVVPVSRRQCRQHEWMSKHQWRLSFSRAEIVLLNSSMPVQQIVYHVLRVFVKTERLTESADNSEAATLSNYHIKTLMLWACEMKPRSWWIDDLNVVRLTVELLRTLGVWLTGAGCPHYFIRNCNLFGCLDNCETIASRLRSLTEASIADWFIHSYIRKCAHLCPGNVSRLFDDVSTIRKLQDAVSAVVEWRLAMPRLPLAHFLSIAVLVSFKSVNLRTCSSLMILAKHHVRLSVYFTAFTFLQVAYRVVQGMLSDEMLDVLLTTLSRSQSVDARRCLKSRRSSLLSLTIATELMKVVANKSRSTVQLIEIELSKAYLYRALRCKDYDSDSIYCLANVYLSVLYYITGHYKAAIDHCLLLTSSQDHVQNSSRVVQGELLPKVDDSVDNTLGLAVFYQYIRSAMLDQESTRPRHIVSVFTAQLFACYLHVRYLSVAKCNHVTKMSLTDAVQQYQDCVCKLPEMFVTDLVVFKLAIPTKYPRRDRGTMTFTSETKSLIPRQLDTSDLIELLQKSAIKHLTTFRQLEARDFRPVFTVATTDFEALYAYKCGEYQRCLRLSTHNASKLIGGSMLFPVHVYPEFIQLMDDDIVSLTGLTVLVNPSQTLEKLISQLSLSLYLMTQCQLKLHHSVVSLAQTLEYVEVAHRKPLCSTLDHLLLKLISRKILLHVSKGGWRGHRNPPLCKHT